MREMAVFNYMKTNFQGIFHFALYTSRSCLICLCPMCKEHDMKINCVQQKNIVRK